MNTLCGCVCLPQHETRIFTAAQRCILHVYRWNGANTAAAGVVCVFSQLLSRASPKPASESVFILVKALLIHYWSQVNSRKLQSGKKTHTQLSVLFVDLTKSFTPVLRQPCLFLLTFSPWQLRQDLRSFLKAAPASTVAQHCCALAFFYEILTESSAARSEFGLGPALSRRLN